VVIRDKNGPFSCQKFVSTCKFESDWARVPGSNAFVAGAEGDRYFPVQVTSCRNLGGAEKDDCGIGVEYVESPDQALIYALIFPGFGLPAGCLLHGLPSGLPPPQSEADRAHQQMKGQKIKYFPVIGADAHPQECQSGPDHQFGFHACRTSVNSIGLGGAPIEFRFDHWSSAFPAKNFSQNIS
jgi:hypothetical protein